MQSCLPKKYISYFNCSTFFLGLVLAFYILNINSSFYPDDSFISLRYAYNFLHGKGLVWNTGEHVQGYTNFLFIILETIISYFGVDLIKSSHIILFSSVILIIILFTYNSMKENTERGHFLSSLPYFLIITSAPLLSWTWGGLEGVFNTLLIWISVINLIYSFRSNKLLSYCISGLFFAFALLTRIDNIIFYIISLIFIFISKPRNLKYSICLYILPAVLSLTPYLIWSKIYYGDFLPNTYYVKATDFNLIKLKNGFFYVIDFMSKPPCLFIFLTPLLIIAFKKKKINFEHIYLLTMIITFCIYLIYIGGDILPWYRFVLPIIPLGIFLLFQLLIIIIPKDRILYSITIYAIFIILTILQIYYCKINSCQTDMTVKYGTMVGKYINEHWPANTLIALNTAGSTPYYALNHRFIDMLGLNDAHIARRNIDKYLLPWQLWPGHSKGDGKYVLSRKPDYIIIGPEIGNLVSSPIFLSDLEIQKDSSFYKNYKVHCIPLKNFGFTFYKRI